MLAGRTFGGEKGTGTLCAQHPPGPSGKWCLFPFSPVPALGSRSLLLSLVNPAPWAAYAMAGLFLAVGVLAAWAWSLSGGHPDSQLAGGMQMGVQIAATAAPAAGKPATAPIRPKGPTDLRLPTRTAHNSGPSAASQPPAPIVGRITGIIDAVGRVACDDIDRNVVAQAGTPVRLNWTFLLTSGQLEMTYNSGASVLIEGPARYAVEQENGGFLTSGKLTVNVHRQGGGPGPQREQIGKSDDRRRQSGPSNPEPLRPPPVFTLRAPTAVVSDADAEFVIQVDKSGGNRTRVLRGQVDWGWRNGSRHYVVALKEKYRASVELSDGVATVMVITGRPTDFARELLRKTPSQVPVVAVPNMKKPIEN